MKPLHKLVSIASFIAAAISITTSCESESVIAPATQQITPEITQQLVKIGVNPTDAVITTTTTPDGVSTAIVSAGESMIPLNQLFNYPVIIAATNQKAFVHTNIVAVGDDRVISIVVRDAVKSESIAALETAVEAYNRLGLRFRFSIAFGTQDGDIIVYRTEDDTQVLPGRSYLPYQGNPGGAIELFPALDAFNSTFKDFILKRQLGRAVGLRSSDWRTRRSCGDAADIIDATVVHIPGTDDSGDNIDSIMTECLGSHNMTGEDFAALRFLYGDTSVDLCVPNPKRCDQSKRWKYFFCGRCYYSPARASRNGCDEARSCLNEGDSNTTKCVPNGLKCNPTKPWIYYFCGVCVESPQQAIENGCEEAKLCFE